MFNKKARLITTLCCARNCKGCCNTPEMINTANRIKDIKGLDGVDEINITGGEPMMYPIALINILHQIHKFKKKPIIYLYMSLCNPVYDIKILKLVDGVHYTIHSDCTDGDIEMFVHYQNTLKLTNFEKSYRLHIFPEVKKQIPIIPNLWCYINFKPWEKNSPLPEGEELFILKNGFENNSVTSVSSVAEKKFIRGQDARDTNSVSKGKLW